MHSSGSMIRIRSNSWMQSTGQTSTQERSLMSMQGSAMMYVTAGLLYRRQQLLDHLCTTLLERRLGEHLVEACGMRATETRRVRVAREADNRDVGPRVGDLLGLDPGDVREHELRFGDRVRGH